MLVGRPMRSSQLSDTLLPKTLAMPVFCSDPLSSVAYATEQILLILSLGGLAFLHLAWYVAAVIVGERLVLLLLEALQGTLDAQLLATVQLSIGAALDHAVQLLGGLGGPPGRGCPLRSGTVRWLLLVTPALCSAMKQLVEPTCGRALGTFRSGL